MKKINLLVGLLVVLSFPVSAFAVSKPTVDSIPSSVDADFYTLVIHVDEGAKVTVLGGPSFVPPTTDGVGNALDGTVEVLVGLSQNATNNFSIAAELNGDFSDTRQVSIKEATASSSTPGDHTAPAAPTIDPVQNPVEAYEYTINGSTESNANIYVKRTDGSTAGSTQANGNGIFSVTVDLEANKTNRLNISAEDAAYNVGPATQIVIQAVEPENSKTPDDGPTIEFVDEDKSFPDVPEYHDNRVAIEYLKENNYVGGYPDGTFQPAKSVNRAEFTKIIVGAKGMSAGELAQYATSCFPDVKASDWFASYVCYAKDEGIISGYSDGEFKPSDTINVVEASKIVVNTLGVPKINPEGSSWYSEFLESLSTLDYLPTSFRSLTQNVNRGEMSEMVWRILEEIQDKSSVQFGDLN